MGIRTPNDLGGKTVNHLTAVRQVFKERIGKWVWECKCECGKLTYKTRYDLVKGIASSCGCKRRYADKSHDIAGQRFGKLVAVRPVGHDRWHSRVWECKCECGNMHTTTTSKLRRGETTSCGCRRVNVTGVKHGALRVGAPKPLSYTSWLRMRSKRDCDLRWTDYRTFVEDMGERRPGERLVRLDPTKPYSMENCEWR